MTRRIRSVALALAVPLIAAACGSEGEAAPAAQVASAPADAPPVMVYKDPGCTCCDAWVEHMREAGYDVTVQDRTDVNDIKDMLGIPYEMRSCHTAEIGRYLVEGHVPASDVGRLLAEEPAYAGIAAPGMPVGSPGMEIPGRPADRYDVMAFDADGRTTVFAPH